MKIGATMKSGQTFDRNGWHFVKRTLSTALVVATVLVLLTSGRSYTNIPMTTTTDLGVASKSGSEDSDSNNRATPKGSDLAEYNTKDAANQGSEDKEPVLKALKRGGAGIVLSDIRDGYISQEILWFLKVAIPTLPPGMPVELFVSTNAVVDDDMQRFIDETNRISDPESPDYHPVTVRRTPHFSDQVPGIDLNSKVGSHIAKFYAVLHSSFDFPIYFDADVWLCDGWYDKVLQKARKHPDADLIWTLSPSAYGATKGLADAYVSKEQIDPYVEEYKKFPERQGGTIIIVRRTQPSVQAWLLEAMHIFTLQTTNSMDNNTNADGSEGILRKAYTDQGSLREATFIHRRNIVEHVFNGEPGRRGDDWACRAKVSTEACQCDPCFLIHRRSCFYDRFETRL